MGLFRRSKGEAEADASRKVAETELEANDASRGGVYLFFWLCSPQGSSRCSSRRSHGCRR